MPYRVVVSPASEPLTLAETKNYLKVTTSADDNLISDLIEAARISVEKFCRIGILPQTIVETYDYWPRGRVFELSVSPLRSASAIYYKNSAGVDTLWDSSNYVADLYRDPARIQAAYSVEFPILYDEINSVSAIYTVGYDDASAMPTTIKKAMYSTIADAYQNRTNYIKKLPTEVEYYLTSVGLRKFSF